MMDVGKSCATLRTAARIYKTQHNLLLCTAAHALMHTVKPYVRDHGALYQQNCCAAQGCQDHLQTQGATFAAEKGGETEPALA